MVRLAKRLDPTQNGAEAESLESELRRMIAGQDDAIQQIIDVYQTYLAGLGLPARRAGDSLFLRAIRITRDACSSARLRSQIYRLLRRYFEAGTLVMMRARGRIHVPRVSLCRFSDCFWFTLHSSQPPTASTSFAAIA